MGAGLVLATFCKTDLANATVGSCWLYIVIHYCDLFWINKIVKIIENWSLNSKEMTNYTHILTLFTLWEEPPG